MNWCWWKGDKSGGQEVVLLLTCHDVVTRATRKNVKTDQMMNQTHGSWFSSLLWSPSYLLLVVSWRELSSTSSKLYTNHTETYSFYDVAILCFRKARFEASLMRRSWEISWADVIMDQGNMRLGQASRISLTSQSTAFRTQIVRIQNATYMWRLI